ncbi:hypothetical protein ACWEF6_02685 [Amycolatopsis sp. NPDC004772]
MANFAILIEYELPDDVDFAVQAASPALDLIRNLPLPGRPELVTAFAAEAAEAMTQARQDVT